MKDHILVVDAVVKKVLPKNMYIVESDQIKIENGNIIAHASREVQIQMNRDMIKIQPGMPVSVELPIIQKMGSGHDKALIYLDKG